MLNSSDLRQLRMHPVTEPVEQQPRQGGNSRGAKEWLDTFSTGGCDSETLLRGAGELLQRTPDAGWDLLALVDQYYRRGKISAESFGVLKSHLQGMLVGRGQRNFSSPGVPATSSVRPVARPSADTRALPEARKPPETFRPGEALRQPEPASAAQELPRPPRTLAVGDVLRDRYVVRELLGRGGMGTVFAASDQYRVERAQGEQRVALKVLHTDVIKRPRLFTELRREFQHLQSLSHPNIVRVHEFDQDGDLAFFTMEYLSGSMLSRVLAGRESGLPRPYALAIVRDVGAAIAHAHSRGVVHGDLNPGNIFITGTGDVRVFDFGASHQLFRGPLVAESDNLDHIAVATALYASCQVLEGAPTTVSDDIYALACVAYVLLTGDHPFQEDNALRARSARMKPARPRGLRGGQWRALKAGLRFDRERRPSNIEAWLTQLDLHAGVPQLPAVDVLSTLRPSRPADGARWIKYAAVAAVIAVCGWWSNQHFDTVVDSATNVQARVESWFNAPAVSEWWNPSRSLSRKPDPVIDYPSGNEKTAPPSRAAPNPEPAKPPIEADHEAAAAPTVPAADSTTTVAAATFNSTAPAAAQTAPAKSFTGPRARLELATDTVEVSPTDSVAHLVVRRTRSSRGDVSFTWWTESGTALPGRDFTPVKAHVEHIDNGQNAANLSIPVTANPLRQVPRNFYVVIDQPSDNATVGPRTLTMISLAGAN